MLSPDVLRRALDEVELEGAAQVFIAEGIPLQLDPQAHTAFLTTSRLLAREVGLQPGERAILVNGRVCCLFSLMLWNNKMTCIARRSYLPSFEIRFGRLCNVGKVRNKKASWTCRASS